MAGREAIFSVIFRAVDQMSAVTSKIGGAFKGLGKQVEEVNAAVAKTAKIREFAGDLGIMSGGLAAVGAGVSWALKSAVENADVFEDHIARLGTALGQARDKQAQLARAESFVRAESITTGAKMNDLTEAVYEGVSGFLSMDQAIAVTDRAARLARATQGDLAATTKMLTTAMLNFSDSTKSPIQNATILADKMTALQTQFKFSNLSELTEAMQYAGPAAVGLGVNLNQTLAALATLSA
jgi:TP901 family phage tail tape measure protein